MLTKPPPNRMPPRMPGSRQLPSCAICTTPMQHSSLQSSAATAPVRYQRGTSVRYVQTTGRLASSVVHAPPEPLPEGHVRLAVAYVGVCHSDLAAVAEGEGDFPRRLGHEVSGVVTESAAAARPPGTRVAAYISYGYASEI